MGPITIDEVTGAISFIPDIAQVAAICIKVEEYRQGIKIGELTKDLQFNIFANCGIPNVTPNTLSPLITSSLTYEAFAGTELCFDIQSTDANSDSITLSSNNQLSGTFNPSLPFQSLNTTSQFCWTPDNLDIGMQYFTVSTMDDGCLPRSNSYTFQINVLPSQNNPEVSSIPTIGEWGMIILAMGFLIFGVVAARNKERFALT